MAAFFRTAAGFLRGRAGLVAANAVAATAAAALPATGLDPLERHDASSVPTQPRPHVYNEAQHSPAAAQVREGAHELHGARLSRSAELQSWRRGTTHDRLARIDPGSIEPDRRVVALVGITGSGKSSTANMMAGRTHKSLATSSGMTSVTDSVSYRDYDFFGAWRVLDTPGLQDTNKSREENLEELARFAFFAPRGVTAFLVTVPHGRFTAEHLQTLQALERLFGPTFRQYAILIVTSAMNDQQLMHRSDILDEISGLPIGHYLRRFTEDIALRVVPVENRLDPHRQTSRMAVHQAVLDLLERNGNATYDCSRFLRRDAPSAETEAEAFRQRLGRCHQSVVPSEHDPGKLLLRIDCELDILP